MSRSEFSAQVRKDAWKRCKERCEAKGCGIKLQVGHYEFDHVIPDGLRGKPTLENCAVLCSAHHSVKTHTVDRPMMQKADNVRAKHLGLGERKRGFPKPPPGYNPWTRRIER
jgi:5-methylcytosine-specific restriction protein A